MPAKVPDASTVNAMFVVAVRPCASVIVTGIDFAPGVTESPTVASNPKVPSPLSLNVAGLTPPMLLRSGPTCPPAPEMA